MSGLSLPPAGGGSGSGAPPLPPPPEGGRLGLWSLSFLRDRPLRDALRLAGWRPRPGFLGADAHAVWGRSAAARRGIAAARLTGLPLLTLEEGFLAGLAPGRGGPRLSLLIDDLGVHWDADRPSRLEALIAAGGGDRAAARAGMARLRALRLSRWNDAPDHPSPPAGHVLVIDQLRGDPASGGEEASFRRMLAAARAEHPGAEIVVRPHPRASRARPGWLEDAKEARLWRTPANPWDFLEGARAVYAVSSLLGFEALMAEKPVRLFGRPFYAGWGATEDEARIPRRTARRDAAALFAAAWLDFPLWLDPWRGRVADFDFAVDALVSLRAQRRATAAGAVLSGVRLWKRAQVARLFAPAPVAFAPPSRAAARARASGRPHVVWASAAPPGAGDARLEDGFLRSVGLGAALVPAASFALDDLGVHYDPSRESRLERLIASEPADPDWRRRASALRAALVAGGVTKYNLAGGAPPPAPPGRRVVLCAGQVADDAALRLAGAGLGDADLLRAAREARLGAFLLWKPHPDAEAGLRRGFDAAALADAALHGVSAIDAIEAADEVWTVSSLLGFEALIRGRPVTALGAPFYAGWGLTEDRGPVPARRRARPDLLRLIHAALIEYPLHLDPEGGRPCPPEVVLARLAAGPARRAPALRLLARLQGLGATLRAR